MSEPWIADTDSHWSRHGSPESLGYIIRYAELPDNPGLLASWIDRTVRLPELSARERWQRMRGCINLLLEAYADTLNPHHWRSTCLKYLHSLRAEMRMLADQAQQHEQHKRLLWEIQVTGFFFDPYTNRRV